MLIAVIALLGGVILLTVCAEIAVTAAERISEHLGISPVIIGALVVGLGTSLPELVVSGIAAAQRDTIDLAMGNVIGSNAANLSLVLGVGAIITTMGGKAAVMRREGLLMLASTSLFAAFVIDGRLTKVEGAILLIGMAAAALIIARTPGTADDPSAPGPAAGESKATIIRAIVGLIGVVIGAQLMVTGAVDIAEEFGASEAFIGLSIVAMGTSLPELATTIVSARRGSVDLVIGNVLGSNLFNGLAVAGLAGLVGTGTIDESVTPSLVAMLAVSVFVVGWGIIRHSFDRRIGLFLVVAYGVIIAVGL